MNRRYFLSLLAGLMAACASKKELENVENGESKESEKPAEDSLTVNGTKITEGNNLYGVIQNTKGAGISSVPVTDGYQFVRTDVNGVYQMKADSRSSYVYYTLPTGYAIPQDETTHLPLFYKAITPTQENRVDFTLQKLTAASSAFTFAVLGDIHIRDKATATQFTNGTMQQLGQYFTEHPDEQMFGVSLGDIINNAKDADTFSYAAQALGSASCGNNRYLPFYTVIGNHDHNARLGNEALSGMNAFDKATDGDYNRAFGPTCYSFNVGKVHFVSLDNFIALAPPSSDGTALASEGQTGFTDKVYEWLAKDLALVKDKESKMVVLLVHCHMRGFTGIPNREGVLDLLAAFNSAYIFSGHAHICETYKYSVQAKNGRGIMERIHGVPMGNFWYSRYNPDSAPAGFFLYHVDGNEFSDWEYRCLHDPEEQMRVYDSNEVYDNESDWSRQYAWTKESLFAGGNFLLAHIYNGDEDWEVSLEHDGITDTMTFADKRIYDYCVISHLANDNVAGIRTSWKYHWDRSENWWYFKLDKPASELKNWKVTAIARFPGSSKTRTYVCDKLTHSVSET